MLSRGHVTVWMASYLLLALARVQQETAMLWQGQPAEIGRPSDGCDGWLSRRLTSEVVRGATQISVPVRHLTSVRPLGHGAAQRPRTSCLQLAFGNSNLLLWCLASQPPLLLLNF